MSKEGTPISQEDTPRKFERIKRHVKENKERYLIGASCLAAGYLLGAHTAPDVVQTFTDSKNNIGTVINRSKNVEVVIQYLNQRNYPANPVQCVETLEKWGSQAEAAVAKGISETNLSQHLNGKYPHANNLHFVRL